VAAAQVFNHTGETGTYRYMAPEVFRHEPYNGKADVRSARPAPHPPLPNPNPKYWVAAGHVLPSATMKRTASADHTDPCGILGS